MSILGGAILAGDKLTDVADYVSDAATSVDIEASSFIGDLIGDSGIDFEDMGQHRELDYIQWDYNAELDALRDRLPDYMNFNTAEVNGMIAQISGVAVPAAPALSLPGAVIPTFDAERPVITMPQVPSTAVGAAPTDAPVLDELLVPDAPNLALPNVPTFEALAIPVPPSYQTPSFLSAAPAFDLSPPTQQFAFVDAGYTSSLRDPLVAKLLGDLQNGGYGIEAADETALWTRAMDRAAATGRVAAEEARKRASDMSFPMPQGALYSDMERAHQVYQGAVGEASREIALKRADMYVANRRFTIEQVQSYEKLDRDLYNAIAERALNVSKATVELGISVYEASVKNFQARLEAHRVEAQVFETRVRAELAKAEQFRAQIEAEKLRGEFNMQRVQLYQAQLNGVQSVANLYKTRVEATGVLAQIQANKMEMFKTRVEAYATTVRAKASEFDMYRAAVQGQVARVDIYKADVEAYEARLRGEDLRTKVLAQGNEALIQRYRAQLAQYTAQLDGAAKKVDAALARDRTFIAVEENNISVYRALTDAIIAGVAQKKDTQRLNNDWNVAAINTHIQATKMKLEQFLETQKYKTDIHKFGAKFYGDALLALLSNVTGLSVKSA